MRPAVENVLVGAGDIASCATNSDEATAELVEDIPGIVVAIGDTVYERGSREEYLQCYDDSWGRFKDRTRPAVGDHEYQTPSAAGFSDYFGSTAGPPEKFYYSYDVGEWHVIVLNSNCGEVGGCEEASPQGRWLHRDLDEHPARCVLAYWHRPLFSSRGMRPSMSAFWELLYAGGADVVLSGNDHHYERFAPQDPQGLLDNARGIRQFIVGTGGKTTSPFRGQATNSEVLLMGVSGVIKLTLLPTEYEWLFLAAPGSSAGDSGSDVCH